MINNGHASLLFLINHYEQETLLASIMNHGSLSSAFVKRHYPLFTMMYRYQPSLNNI